MSHLSSILWPEEQVARLKELIAERLTSGQIAKVLQTTRNAVIGKIHRMGLALISDEAAKAHSRPAMPRTLRRIAPTKFVVVNGQKQEERPMEPRKPKPDEPMLKLSLFDLEEHNCRWPLEERGEYDLRLFCGRDASGSSSYCAQHRRQSKGIWRR